MADINLIVATNADKVTNDFNRLGNTVLSQVKKAQQLERGYKTLDVAFNKGQISAQKYARGITQIDKSIKMALTGQSQLAASTNRTAAAMNTMSAAQAVSTRRMGRGSVITQQAGYQVGDFLVQIQGGTNAFVAFGQQATQIAGTMTILGGKWVLIGSALGIIIPLMTALGAAFARTGTDASFLGDSLDTISPLLDSIAKAANYLKEVFLDTANIIVNNIDRIIVYGLSLAGFFAGKLVLAFVAARVAAMGFVGALVAIKGALLRTGIGILVVVAGELVYQFVRLVKAAGGFGQAMGLLKAVGLEAFEKIWLQGRLMLVNLKIIFNDIQFAWIMRIGRMKVAWGEMVDWMASTGPGGAFGIGLMGGNAEAANTEQSAAIRENIDAMLELQSLQQSISADVAMSPTGALDNLKALMDSIKNGDSIDVRDWDLFGGKKDDDDDSATESALEKMKAELALMEELVGKSEEYKYVRESMGDEYDNLSAKSIEYYEGEYARIQKAIEAEEDRKSIIDTVSQSLTDGLTAMVEGTKSVKDAFKDMAREIIKQLWEIFVIKQITGVIERAFGFADGGAFKGGNVIPFANGGVVGGPTTFGMAGGKTGLMGEAGPEAIMPLKRGADGKLGVEASGGGGSTVITQNFNFSANGDESVKKIIAQAAPQIAQMTQKSMMDQRRRGGAMKATFG